MYVITRMRVKTEWVRIKELRFFRSRRMSLDYLDRLAIAINIYDLMLSYLFTHSDVSLSEQGGSLENIAMSELDLASQREGMGIIAKLKFITKVRQYPKYGDGGSEISSRKLIRGVERLPAEKVQRVEECRFEYDTQLKRGLDDLGDVEGEAILRERAMGETYDY